MIYVNKPEVSETSFVDLLDRTKKKIESDFRSGGIPNGIDGLVFEGVVYTGMVESARGSEFEGLIEQTSAHAFPDIIAKKLYGVEVKMTTGDKWISTGNSVLETSRIESVKTIYMFFGKFGKGFEAKYRKYEDCLYDVGVTHSPRYRINMELRDGGSIFHKMGLSYESFRKDPNSIKHLKEYYRQQLKDGEELWWIDPTNEEKSVSPVIKSFRLLDETSKERYINEVFVLFPEIFGNSTSKFERAAAYLITEYNAVSSSLRDTFTAGGQEKIGRGLRKKKVSRLLYNFYLRAAVVKQTLDNLPNEKLFYYWNTQKEAKPFEVWLNLIEKFSKNSDEGINATEVFEKGLENGKN